MEYNYNVYDILTIKSSFELSFANTIYPTFNCFETSKNFKSFDLIVNLSESNSIQISEYQEIAPGLFYCRNKDSIVSNFNVFGIKMFWEIKNLFHANTEINISKFYKLYSKLIIIPVSSVYPLNLLIRMIMQIKLLLKNATFLVGSGVILDEQGIIFTGRANAGKTTAVINIMKCDCLKAKFLSEDLMILNDNNVYGLPSVISQRKKNFGIVSYHSHLDPYKHYKMRIAEKLNGNFDIYFLIKTHFKKIERISYEEGINKLCNLNNFVHPIFNERILATFSYVHNNYSALYFQRKQHDILSKSLKNAKFYIFFTKDPNDYIEEITYKYKENTRNNEIN